MRRISIATCHRQHDTIAACVAADTVKHGRCMSQCKGSGFLTALKASLGLTDVHRCTADPSGSTDLGCPHHNAAAVHSFNALHKTTDVCLTMPTFQLEIQQMAHVIRKAILCGFTEPEMRRPQQQHAAPSCPICNLPPPPPRTAIGYTDTSQGGQPDDANSSLCCMTFDQSPSHSMHRLHRSSCCSNCSVHMQRL